MAITSTGANAATAAATKQAQRTDTKDGNPNGVLGKDDFLKLLLVELQYQDPTSPTDTEKILSQTSQLATLESAGNTNKALEALTASLGNSQQFSTIAAIGKTADIGSNAISYEEGSTSRFEVYFPDAVENGNLEVLDNQGNIISTIELEKNEKGVFQFDWDGTLADGSRADSGIYHITASYKNPQGESLTTRMGIYPIESVRFDEGKALVKVGSSYLPLDKIKEIY